MQRQKFFSNFGSILLIAILGTFISTFFVALILFFFANIGIIGINMGLLECLVVGAILSSTDPVSILSGICEIILII